MNLALINGMVFLNGKFVKKNIVIANGKIKNLTSSKPKGKSIDCSGKLILPGLIDVHVHFRTPGQEFKEDWLTGSQAALAGGVTTVLDMPNNSPSITSMQALNEKRNLVKKNALVNYGFYLGASNENIEEILKAKNVCGIKIFIGSSTGNLLVEKQEEIKKVLEAAKKKNFLACIHAEDEELIQRLSKAFSGPTFNNVKYHSMIRADECELKAVKKVIELIKQVKTRIHFCHVSTEEALKEIEKAKKEKLNISCEVCPHHLFLNSFDAEKLGNFGKMNPPLRGLADQKALISGIEKNLVDVIATDHAPHTIEEKNKPYFEAPSGVPGLETMFSLLYNFFENKPESLKKVIEMSSKNPAKIFNIAKKGEIKKGFDADLFVFNPEKEWIVKNEELFTKCKWSPFNGRKLKGKVEKTIVNGNLVFDEGKFFTEFKGKEVF